MPIFNLKVLLPAGLSLYLIFLVITLPASQIINRIALPPNISFAEPEGTIWNGRTSNLKYNGVLFNQISWEMAPLKLLLGRVELEVNVGSNRRNSQDIKIDGTVALGFSSFSVNNLTINAPAERLIGYFPLPVPLEAEGRFNVDIKEAEFTQHCQTIDAIGKWNNASVSGMAGMIDMGNFIADISCQQPNILVSIKDANLLGIDAVATINPKFNVSVQGRFKPDPSLPREVHQAAQFFGAPDGEGYFPLAL